MVKNRQTTYQLPADVRDDWTPRLWFADCHLTQFTQMQFLIKLALPYPSIESVRECLAGLKDAFPHNSNLPDTSTIEAVLAKLEDANKLNTSVQYASSHPLATAIKKIRRAADLQHVNAGPWLKWILTLCAQAQDHAEELTPSSYYRHTVYARDVVIFVMRHQTTGDLAPDQSVDQACVQLNKWFEREAQTGEPMPFPVTGVKNLSEKTDVIVQLLDGIWQFGVPSFHRNGRAGTTAADSNALPPSKKPTKRSEPLPKILTPTTEELKATQPTKKQPRRQSLSYSLGEANDASSELITQPVPSSDPAEPESGADSNSVETAHFSAPPEFSVSERRNHYGSLLNIQAAHNVASRSDMQRFSRRQLSTWLAQFAEEDSLTAVFYCSSGVWA